MIAEIRYILIFIAFVICCLFLTFRKPFLLKNLFLVYVFLIYNIAPLVFGESDVGYDRWFTEYVIIVLVFVFGYQLGKHLIRRTHQPIIPALFFTQRYFKRVKKQKMILLGLYAINFAYISLTAIIFSLSDFYSGGRLVAVIADYGSASAEGAAMQVVSFVLTSSTMAVLAVFLESSFAGLHASRQNVLPGHKRRERLMIMLSAIWLLLFPLIQFGRGAFFFGCMAFLAIWFWSRKRFSVMLFVSLSAAAVFVFIIIGQSRGDLLGEKTSVSGLFASELSPWIAYRDIKDNIDYLNYQHGSRLFIPFISRIIPRGLWPEKPQNSAGYFNNEIYPDASQAGFMLAPTYMGAMYLNFGLTGVFVGIGLLGVFSGWMDGIVIYQRFQKLGLFIVVFASYLSILRNDPSVAFFDLTITILLYRLIYKWMFGCRRKVPNAASLDRNDPKKELLGIRKTENEWRALNFS